MVLLCLSLWFIFLFYPGPKPFSLSLPVALFSQLFALVDSIYYHLIFIIIETVIVVQRMLYQE